MRHIETGAISPNKLYPDYKLPAATSDRHFLCSARLTVFRSNRHLSSATRCRPSISQGKVGQDFFGIADVSLALVTVFRNQQIKLRRYPTVFTTI